MITYWLYYGGEPIASVRECRGQSDNTIRGIAIAQHERNPTIYADMQTRAPFEHAQRLRNAQVRTFEGDR